MAAFNGPAANGTAWRYGIGMKQETRGLRRVLLTHERVWKNDKLILDRPDEQDGKDEFRLTETHLEQISANREFRPLAEVFQKILYLHLVPQLLKFPHLANRDAAGEDPFGIRFIDHLMETPEKTRRSRLKKCSATTAFLPTKLHSSSLMAARALRSNWRLTRKRSVGFWRVA